MKTEYRSQVQEKDFHTETRSFFHGRKVAVTGGSGFIGSHLVEQLIQLGARPIVLTRQKEPTFLQAALPNVELRQVDLFDPTAISKGLTGTSVVLHVAATVAGIEYNKNHPASIFQDNLQAFFNTIRAANNLNIERFLVTSSACVYPRFCTLPTPESEGMQGEPEPTNSGYGWAKRMEEYLGKKYSEEFGLPVAIARPYNAYGPRDNFDPKTSHVIPALILKAVENVDGKLTVWGDGSHSRSFLYVDDFARGLLEVAARYPKADPVNLGAHEEITIRELAFLVAEIVGTRMKKKLIPVFDPQGITGQPRRMCDTSKAEAELGYRASVTFRAGLERTIDWFLRDRGLM
ncbi:MAG: NAD-dependent epimerase/dehydratase family protein [Oligoflexia bacterium]|nr:NAD-dependent epimerase/dehydratase family protein [Oligoflexia bacterium]